MVSATRKAELLAHRKLQRTFWPKNASPARDQLALMRRLLKERQSRPAPMPPILSVGEVKTAIFGTPHHREQGQKLVLRTGDYGDLVLATNTSGRQRKALLQQAVAMFTRDPAKIGQLPLGQLRRYLRAAGVVPTSADREQCAFQLRRVLSLPALSGGSVVLREDPEPIRPSAPEAAPGRLSAASEQRPRQRLSVLPRGRRRKQRARRGRAAADGAATPAAAELGESNDADDSDERGAAEQGERGAAEQGERGAAEQGERRRAAASALAAIPSIPVPHVGDAVSLRQAAPARIRLSADTSAGTLYVANLGRSSVRLGGCGITCAYRARPRGGPDHNGGFAEHTGGRWSEDEPTAHFSFPEAALLPPLGVLELHCGPRSHRKASPAPEELPAPGCVQRLAWDVAVNPLLRCWSLTLSDPEGGRHQTVAADVLRQRHQRLREAEAAARAVRSEWNEDGSTADRAPRPDAVLQEFVAELQAHVPDPLDDWEDLGQGAPPAAGAASRELHGPERVLALQRAQAGVLAKRPPKPLRHPSLQQGLRQPTCSDWFDGQRPGLMLRGSRLVEAESRPAR
eukprot:TRINITY_DN8711_c0_g2_i1.p1 TRINITY_DN8711_c0_g2~~TRINITY_DN8711_c0_g2_i1.p1  ORF type:complete len:571 (+),score=136.82 TRINITY_DN8711_c0_g2_i1:84-1796(+)